MIIMHPPTQSTTIIILQNYSECVSTRQEKWTRFKNVYVSYIIRCYNYACAKNYVNGETQAASGYLRNTYNGVQHYHIPLSQNYARTVHVYGYAQCYMYNYS